LGFLEAGRNKSIIVIFKKMLEQKVLGLQEELTELHRKRGENASQVLALSAKLTDREAELELNRNGCAAAIAKSGDLEDQVNLLQSRLHE
jgi:autophagy-related protein 16